MYKLYMKAEQLLICAAGTGEVYTNRQYEASL